MEVKVDFSHKIGEARDQAGRNMCLVFAATSAHEYLHDEIDLSQSLCVEWLYYHAIKVGKSNFGEGTSVEEISSVLEHLGQPFEEVWRYDPETNFQEWHPPLNPGKCYFAKGIYTEFNLQHLMKELDWERPAVIIFWYDRDFQFPRKSGDYLIVEQRHSLFSTDLHAVLAVGYGEYDDRTYLKVRNSWGCNWGMGGDVWLSQEFLAESAIASLQLFRLE